ncbi:hypothetical protein [Variovorax sp. dw_954]|uniref:hypothetical protein n=1 Tax=Variovorax sp. dw_954 TaxID=2720078 RepID=UPI001BD4EE51|nr:hypothetical protein [Variovorax sp. dw_954]
MNPASAQHAALRILLEDVDPLLQRADEAAQTLTKVREELGADLTTLGQLVQQSVDAQPVLLEAGRKLTASAARIEAALQLQADSGPGQAQRRPGAMWVACATSALLSAAFVSGIAWIGSREMMEQARIGRALQSAWTSMDAATRNKVNDLLSKS